MSDTASRRTLEPLLRVQIDLLRLCNLLQDVLNNHSIIHADISANELNSMHARRKLTMG